MPEGAHQKAHEEEEIADEAGLADDVADAVGAQLLVVAQCRANLRGGQLVEGLSSALHCLPDEDSQLYAILRIIHPIPSCILGPRRAMRAKSSLSRPLPITC